MAFRLPQSELGQAVGMNILLGVRSPLIDAAIILQKR